MHLQLPNNRLVLTKPVIVGIVNITTDSFSDGGEHATTNAAIKHAWHLVEQGAGMIDLGAESTRPGAQPVDAHAQLDRLLPVIEALAPKLPVPISVDTADAAVITRLANTGVAMINDVYALRKPDALAAFAKTDMAVCLTHMQQTPATMQHNPQYDNVVRQVCAFLLERAQVLVDAGVAPERIALDPGFGFGKSVAHNYQLLNHLGDMHIAPHPTYVGISRKSMLTAAVGECVPKERNHASLSAELLAAIQGVHFIRTHQVKPLNDALNVISCMKHYGHK